MITFVGKTVNEVWEQAFSALDKKATQGFSDSSRDGAVVGEFLDAVFCVEDPTRSIVTSKVRNMPMRYAVGELVSFWLEQGEGHCSVCQEVG